MNISSVNQHHSWIIVFMILFAGQFNPADIALKRPEVPASKSVTFQSAPLNIAVVGLVHDHVNWILGREKSDDIQVVAIVEPNQELAQKYSTRYGFSMDMVYPSLEKMYAEVKPEAVTAFNAIFDHLDVVEFCAPRGIHVMVEKPLAVNVQHMEKMISLARQNQIHLLTNYETTWYGTNWKAYDLIHKEAKIGGIRKMVFYTGHQGPREIGCSEEFLAWLTDPVLNGAGALNDFGCYGANLATWYMEGQTPRSVTCITKQNKPDIYPKVDDDATIILNYEKTEVIIQASWDWPFGRKEMEIYGQHGYVFCKNGREMVVMENDQKPVAMEAGKPTNGISDPFHYLYQVVRHDYREPAFNLSSEENNRIVVQILQAAKESAKEGRTLQWDELYH